MLTANLQVKSHPPLQVKATAKLTKAMLTKATRQAKLTATIRLVTTRLVTIKLVTTRLVTNLQLKPVVIHLLAAMRGTMLATILVTTHLATKLVVTIHLATTLAKPKAKDQEHLNE